MSSYLTDRQKGVTIKINIVTTGGNIWRVNTVSYQNMIVCLVEVARAKSAALPFWIDAFVAARQNIAAMRANSAPTGSPRKPSAEHCPACSNLLESCVLSKLDRNAKRNMLKGKVREPNLCPLAKQKKRPALTGLGAKMDRCKLVDTCPESSI